MPSMEENSKNICSCIDLNVPCRIVLARTAVVYGETPTGIQRMQIVKIAEKMKMDPIILCEKILNMSDQERFTLLKNFCQDNPVLQTFYENFSLYKINRSVTGTNHNESNPTHKLQKKSYQKKVEPDIKKIHVCKLSSKTNHISTKPVKIQKKEMSISISESKTFVSSPNSVPSSSDEISINEAKTLSNTGVYFEPNSEKMLPSAAEKSTFVDVNGGTSNIKYVDPPQNLDKRKCDFINQNGYNDNHLSHLVSESNSILTTLLFDEDWSKLNNYGPKNDTVISTSKNLTTSKNKSSVNTVSDTIVSESKNSNAKTEPSKTSNIFPSNQLLESLLFD